MEIAYLIIGLLIGFVLAFLIVRLQVNKNLEAKIQQHPMVVELRNSAENTKAELTEERKQKENYLRALSIAETNNDAWKEKLNQQNDNLLKTKEEFSKEFENLANKIFEEKTNRITQQNSHQLNLILQPLKEKLGDFEKKVENVYDNENKERIHLKVEIEKLFEMNSKLSTEANNLATALKGSNKQQGNWGEMILEKILERSGLQAGIEFQTQFSDESSSGNRIQPDVVINLPDSKHLIIDSKVSLIAYSSYIAAENETEKTQHIQAHINSIRSHIKLLSEKNYSSARKLNTPDFVLLFMPIEGAFSSALQTDLELYNFAWDKNIVLVSPTTLLATLRTIASIWKQERRTQNAEAIAEEGGKLYDKFVGFLEDLLKVGDSINKSQEEYSKAMNKLAEGRGNLISRVENMKVLGAKTAKLLPSKLKEYSSDFDKEN